MGPPHLTNRFPCTIQAASRGLLPCSPAQPSICRVAALSCPMLEGSWAGNTGNPPEQTG